MLLNGELGATVGCLLGHFPLEFLESCANVIALGLLLGEFVLEFKRHFVITVLGLLKLNPGLVNLSEDIEIFVFVHGCLIRFVDEDAIFISNLFDL